MHGTNNIKSTQAYSTIWLTHKQRLHSRHVPILVFLPKLRRYTSHCATPTQLTIARELLKCVEMEPCCLHVLLSCQRHEWLASRFRLFKPGRRIGASQASQHVRKFWRKNTSSSRRESNRNSCSLSSLQPGHYRHRLGYSGCVISLHQ